jgi:hypothetical protein
VLPAAPRPAGRRAQPGELRPAAHEVQQPRQGRMVVWTTGARADSRGRLPAGPGGSR